MLRYKCPVLRTTKSYPYKTLERLSDKIPHKAEDRIAVCMFALHAIDLAHRGFSNRRPRVLRNYPTTPNNNFARFVCKKLRYVPHTLKIRRVGELPSFQAYFLEVCTMRSKSLRTTVHKNLWFSTDDSGRVHLTRRNMKVKLALRPKRFYDSARDIDFANPDPIHLIYVIHLWTSDGTGGGTISFRAFQVDMWGGDNGLLQECLFWTKMTSGANFLVRLRNRLKLKNKKYRCSYRSNIRKKQPKPHPTRLVPKKKKRPKPQKHKPKKESVLSTSDRKVMQSKEFQDFLKMERKRNNPVLGKRKRESKKRTRKKRKLK